jgi:hypothetical protein
MGFISQDPGGRYRRRAAESRRRAFFAMTVLALTATLSYRWGVSNVRSGETAYKAQAEKLQAEKDAIQQTITSLRSEAESANVRYQQLEERYQQEVPTGAYKQVADAVKKRLDAGIQPQRLLALVQSVRPPKNCTPPVTKRFVMQTPVYKGPHGNVSFGNGAVTVAGQGEPAVGRSGSVEAWYDPGKPVTITFTQTGGKETVKKGLLPIEYATVVGNTEYRFTVAAGERSFISVTSDSCDAQ